MSVKQVTRMEVDGVVVDIRPIEKEVQYRYSDGTASYRQKSLYAVYVDDVQRGWLPFPTGWGGCWTLYSFRPQHERFDPSFHKHDDEEKERYGIQGYYRALSPGALNETENWGEHRRKWDDRNDILANIPKLVALGRMPDTAEMARRLEQWKLDHAERKREDARKEAEYARQRADLQRVAVETAARDAEARLEVLAGLESIRDRFTGQLSNLEAVAIGRAIERYSK